MSTLIDHINWVTWGEVRQRVQSVNPILAEIIDETSPDKNYRMILARYPYGAEIITKGRLNLSHSDKAVPSDILNALENKECPLALQLTHSSELYIKTDKRVIPLDLNGPGQFCNLFEIISYFTKRKSLSVCDLSAGSRSAFILPRVSDVHSHKRLQATYGVQEEAPTALSDHWFVFREIVNSTTQKKKWISEVLFFMPEWYSERHNSKPWLRFYNYLFESLLTLPGYQNSNVEFSLMWEAYAEVIRRKNLKPSPYILDTIKHLLLMSSGATSGFKFVHQNDIALPTEMIENAYKDTYRITGGYAPAIMRPGKLMPKKNTAPIYYSLSHPTLLEGTPIIRKAPSIITELREIKKLVATLGKVQNQENDDFSALQLDTILTFFHTEEDPFGNIISSEKIAESDPTIAKRFATDFAELTFPASSHFLRGCISLWNPPEPK